MEDEINRLFKIGISLQGKPDFSILGISFRGFGLDFTYGDEYRSIGLITGFPF